MPLIERIADFSSRQRLLSHILFWVVVSIIFLNRYTIEEYQEVDKIIYRHCYYMSFMILASYFVAYLIIPKLISAKSYYSIIFYALSGSYLICVCSRLAVVYLLEPLIREPPFGQESLWEIMTDFPKLFLHYFALAFSFAWLFAFFKLIKGQYLIQQRSLRLEKGRAQAELKALKSQLNPHFLFNTLNNIYSLSLMNSPVTSRSIAGLSEILDHVLYRCNSAAVPIASEIKLIENYVELEKLRYSDRLQVTFVHHTDEELDIAPLLLLSIVENAFKHGAGENIGRPFIAIQLALRRGKFYFSVTNSFVPDNNKREHDRIGLTNIRKQLHLIYGDDHNLVVQEKEDRFVVELFINLRKDFK